jgi:ABC-type sulfate/molybdate transport systems ATPase subunit
VTGPERALVLEQVSTSAGSFKLGPVDLRVQPGSVLAVLGPSGAGKTVLLDTIAGFRAAASGRVHLGGRDITRVAPEQRRIGVVFQHAALFPHLSVRENVRFGPLARGERRLDRADALLPRFGLTRFADRRPSSLSGGERQRVALARAMAAEPDLLVLDEPLSALDQPTREQLRDVLAELLSRLGVPAIHVTHDRDEALILGDQVAVLVDGKLRQTQSAHTVTSQPVDADVARLLGWAHLGDGHIDQGETVLGDLRLPPPAGAHEADRPVSVFYRPEGVILTPTHSSAAPDMRLTRTIDHVLPTAPLARVDIGGEPVITALVLHRDLARLDLHAGGEVILELPRDTIITFPTQARAD